MTSPDTVQSPDLRQFMVNGIAEAMAKTNCHQIGTIRQINMPPGTVSVTINAKRNYGGKLLDYPMLTDVPVLFPRGSKAIILLPIAVGDTVLLCFNDRDMDTWWSSGAVASPPNSSRMHSLSDAIAIPGLNSAANPINDWLSTDLQLLNDASGIQVGELIGIFNGTGSLLTVLNLIQAALLALNAKTGPDASAAITAAGVGITALLK